MTTSFTTSELSNGLRYVYAPMPQSQSVYVALTGTVGRRAEADDEVGAAHFLEHLFFDGTKKRPTPLEVGSFIEDIGAEHNASTSQELVSYYAKVTPEHIAQACEFISDIFLNSLLREEDIQKERKVIAQEAVFRRDDPLQSLLRHQYGVLYPGQSVGRSIFDEDVNLENMTQEVIRRYCDRTYIVENFALCIAGNITEQEAARLAERYFAGLRKGEPTVFASANINREKTIVIKQRDVKQAKVVMSFEGLPLNHEKSAALKVLSTVLGTGASSRLNEILRQQLQLVYASGAYTTAFSDTGALTMYAFMDEAKLPQAVAELCHQGELLARELVTDKELARAKAQLLSKLLFAAEDTANVGDLYLSQYLLAGDIKDVATLSKEIKAVTREEVMEVAKRTFADAPKVSVVAKELTALDVPAIHV